MEVWGKIDNVDIVLSTLGDTCL